LDRRLQKSEEGCAVWKKQGGKKECRMHPIESCSVGRPKTEDRAKKTRKKKKSLNRAGGWWTEIPKVAWTMNTVASTASDLQVLERETSEENTGGEIKTGTVGRLVHVEEVERIGIKKPTAARKKKRGKRRLELWGDRLWKMRTAVLDYKPLSRKFKQQVRGG